MISRGDHNTCTLKVQFGFFLYASSIDCTQRQSTPLLTYLLRKVSTSVKHCKSNLGAPGNSHQWQSWELQELMRTAILLSLHFLNCEVERSARTDRLWYHNFGENTSYSYTAEIGQSHKQPEVLCKSAHLTLRHGHAVVSETHYRISFPPFLKLKELLSRSNNSLLLLSHYKTEKNTAAALQAFSNTISFPVF